MSRRAIAAIVSIAGALAMFTALTVKPPLEGIARADVARGDSAIVATVGSGDTVRTVTVGEIEDRAASIPAFQRAAMGPTPTAFYRSLLKDVLIRDALLSLGAEHAKLANTPPTSYAIERALSEAVVRAVRARIGPASAIAMDDVRAYYQQNRARYDAPERVLVWRILCDSRSEAQSVLDAARADPTPKTFEQLARDHSQDKATSLRGGNLGFLSADGASNEPGVRVDPGIVAAAHGVKDGAFVPAPVAEGRSYAVIWRRGTIPAEKRTVESVAGPIRDALWQARVKVETDRQIASLRAAKLRDRNADLLDTIDLESPGAESDSKSR
ncbi:MAG: peptidylprolyl isomerase [Polyangiaceae bacterium]